MIINAISFSLAAICFDELVNDLFILSTEFHTLKAGYFSKEDVRKLIDLFIYNPANIFFSTCYTESLFALFMFCGYMLNTKSMILSNRNRNNASLSLRIFGIISFCLGSFTRSNGIFAVPYLIMSNLMVFARKRGNEQNSIRILIMFGISTFLTIVILSTPMWIHNQLGYRYLCTGEFSEDEYCKISNRFFTLNNIYSVVQRKYWNIGIFKFYEVKQIPNFFLATPIYVIVIKGGIDHALFLWKQSKYRLHHLLTACLRDDPYIAHVSVLALSALVCLIMAHIHITTRFLCSSSPMLYFYAAKFERKNNRMYWNYVNLYTILGLIMHPNLLPWV